MTIVPKEWDDRALGPSGLPRFTCLGVTLALIAGVSAVISVVVLFRDALSGLAGLAFATGCAVRAARCSPPTRESKRR